MLEEKLIALFCGFVVSALKQARKFLFLILCLVKCKYAALIQSWMTCREIKIWIVWVFLRKQAFCTLKRVCEEFFRALLWLGVLLWESGSHNPRKWIVLGDFHIGYWKDKSTQLFSYLLHSHWPDEACEYLPAVCQFYPRAPWKAWEL